MWETAGTRSNGNNYFKNGTMYEPKTSKEFSGQVTQFPTIIEHGQISSQRFPEMTSQDDLGR